MSYLLFVKIHCYLLSGLRICVDIDFIGGGSREVRREQVKSICLRVIESIIGNLSLLDKTVIVLCFGLCSWGLQLVRLARVHV